MLTSIAINIPSTASTTLEERYAAFPFKGRWRIVDAWWAPATALSAGDGTNNANVTLATADGDAGAFTVHSTLTGNAVAYAVDVAREFTFTSTIEVVEGDLIRVAKTVNGTGGTIDGQAMIAFEKI